MFIGASVVMRGNHSNPKRLISGGGGGGDPNKFRGSIHRQILRSEILVFFFYSYFKLDRRARGHKSGGQKLRNFGQMTKVLSDANAKNSATFFRPRPLKTIMKKPTNG